MKQTHTFALMATIAGSPFSLAFTHVPVPSDNLTASCFPAAASASDDNTAAPIGAFSPVSLYLQTGVIDTTQPGIGGDLASLANLINAERKTLATRHFVIQLSGPMRPAWRDQLAAAGIDIGDYLPVNAFIVKLNNADAGKVGKLGFIRWYSEYLTAWKVASGIGQRAYFTPERVTIAATGQVVVGVNLFRGEPAPAMVGIISNFPGAQVHWTQNIGNCELIAATMNPGDVAKLAAVPQVQWVEEGPDVDVRNDTNRWIVQSDIPNFTPVYDAGIHGEGQVLGLLDSKVNQNHCSFFDTQPIGPLHRKILAYNASPGSQFHGTHICGTAVGDHGDDTATRGIAYHGKVVYNVTPVYTETAMVASCNTHHMQGARIHTNSWGDDGTTSYNSLCRGVDVFSYDHEDDLILFAVTNTNTLKNPENAKNLLAVGASQDTPSENSLCSGGAGPTSDGRRKPEIFAPGCSTVSADNSTFCDTTTSTGTSMACPAVAASGMLVRQYYMDGYYPTGAAVPSSGFTPTGALVKATLLNSAVDMTGITGYPSNREGWGRVLLDNALFFPSDARKTRIEDIRNGSGLQTSQQTDYFITVLGSGQRLNITLVWTEPAATAGAGVAVVNDLDLEVLSPGETLYKGNSFTAGESSPGGTRDDRNNVEQVQITAPMTGVWTVRVKGTAVNVGTQGYAVVVTGDIPSQTCLCDWNNSGLLDSQDFFDFLIAFFNSSADFNHDAVTNSQDFFDFLACFFGGC